MKTILVTIKEPAEDDLVIVEYSSIRGGCTSVKHRIVGAHQRAHADENGIVSKIEDVPAQTARDVATILAGKIRSEWMPEAFEARVHPDTGALIIGCTGLVNDVTFRTSVAGDGGTPVEIAEF